MSPKRLSKSLILVTLDLLEEGGYLGIIDVSPGNGLQVQNLSPVRRVIGKGIRKAAILPAMFRARNAPLS